jgi:hypothetical protein
MQLTLLLLLWALPAQASRERCRVPAPSEPIVYSDDFKAEYKLDEMAKAFQDNYESGKRLKGRAYYDEKLRSYVMPHHTGPVKIDKNFIRSVTRHVELSLERRYADFIFFPDMGHSHLFFPDKDYNRLKFIEPFNAMYEAFFAYKEMKVLYHTAEKLSVKLGERGRDGFPQDPVLLWRYFSRNPVGDNQGGENVYVLFQSAEPHKYNTVKDVLGHSEYSAGFDLSASKDGCFPYQQGGKTFFFDISLESLPCRNCSSQSEL